MSFIKTPIYWFFLLFLIVIYILFSVKDNVMVIRMQLREVNKQIQYENDAIHLLKAEFAYLSSPERLQELNNKYLSLKETKISQMITDPLELNHNKTKIMLTSSKPKVKSVKWRYKRGPSRYLTLALPKNIR